MLPLRLVLDTNIIVSAALKSDSLPRTLLILALTKPAHLFVSQPTLLEYRTVLSRRELRISKGLRSRFLQLIANRATLIFPSRPLQITGDPADNIFLECADASRADYLITGNLRHFPSFWKKTKIITAREFMQIVAPHLLP